jgi:hypothetical protein
MWLAQWAFGGRFASDLLFCFPQFLFLSFSPKKKCLMNSFTFFFFRHWTFNVLVWVPVGRNEAGGSAGGDGSLGTK